MEVNDQFKELELNAEDFYKKIGKVLCPALNAEVVFNSDGFYHLRYNGARKKRSKQEQRNKLAYLPEAVELLKKSSMVQEYRESMEPIGTTDSKGFKKMIKVGYHAFYGILERPAGKIRLKVIVKEVCNSRQFYFKSVMPYWTEQMVDGKIIKVFAPKKISQE